MRSTGNRLLDTLGSEQLARLGPYLTVEALSLNQIVQKHGKAVANVFFPTSGVISITVIMRDGTSVEVGTVGREGMVGVQAVLGDDTSLNEAMVQIRGSALRL